MPLSETILLEIAARNQASTTLADVGADLGKLNAAATLLDRNFSAIAASSRNVELSFKALDTATKVLDASIRVLGATAAANADAFKAAGDSALAARAAYDAFGTAADASRTMLLASTGAISDQAIVVDALTASYDRLRLSMRLPTTAALTTGTTRALATDAGFLNTSAAQRVLTTGVGAAGGLGGRVAAAALGPEGLAILAGGYLGFKSVQAGANYQSAIAQTGAQVGYNPENKADMARLTQLSQGILNYVGSGQSPYNATTLATSIEQLVAHGYRIDAILQALPAIAAVSAQNKAPDLATAAGAINTLAQLTGQGPNATGAQLTSFSDFLSKIETLTTIPPGQVAAALPKLLAGASGTGLDQNQLGALLLKVGTANPSARLDTTNITRLLQELLVSPTSGAQKTASGLGLSIGSGALAAYGGSITAMVQAYLTATAGPDQAKLLHQLIPQGNAVIALHELAAGGGAAQTNEYQAALEKSSGSAQTAQASYSQGINQRADQLQNLLNADMIRLGNALLPATKGLLDLAIAATIGADSFIKMAGDLGSKAGAFLDSVAGALHVSKGDLGAVGLGPIGGLIEATRGILAVVGKVSGGGGVGTAHAAAATPPDPRLPRQADRRYDPFNPGAPSNPYLNDQGAPGVGAPIYNLPGPTPPRTLGPQLRNAQYALAAQQAQLEQEARTAAILAAQQAVLHPIGPAVNNQRVDGSTSNSGGLTALGGLDAAVQHAIGQSTRAANFAGAVHDARITADQAALTAAQQNLDAAQQMGATPDKLRQVQDAFLTAERQLYQDTLKGTALGSALRGLDKTADVERNAAVLQKQSDAADLQLTAAGIAYNNAVRAGKLPEELAASAALTKATLASAAIADRTTPGKLPSDTLTINADAATRDAGLRQNDAQRKAAVLANQQAEQAQLSVLQGQLALAAATRGTNLHTQLAALATLTNLQLAQAAKADKGDPGKLKIDDLTITSQAVDQQRQLRLAAAQKEYQNLQDRLTLAQQEGKGISAAQDAILRDMKAHPELFTATQVAIQAGLFKGAAAANQPAVTPFAANQPGLGQLVAGIGQTAVRFGGQSAEQSRVAQLERENAELRNQLAVLTRIASAGERTARAVEQKAQGHAGGR